MSRLWSNEEDIALTRAYIECSEDNIAGIGQEGKSLWMKIITMMYRILDVAGVRYEVRTKVAITSRWKKHIFKSMNKWNSACIKAHKQCASGTNLTDEHRVALLLYKTDAGNPWMFDHCWQVAKDWVIWSVESHTETQTQSQTSQFMPGMSSQPTLDREEGIYYPSPPLNDLSPSQAEPDDENLETPSSHQYSARPTGTKSAKKGKGKASSSLETTAQFNERMRQMSETAVMLEVGRQKRHEDNLQQKAMDAEKKERENEAKRLDDQIANEYRIMSMDCSSYTPDTKAYWKGLRKEIQKKGLTKCLFTGSSGGAGAGGRGSWGAPELPPYPPALGLALESLYIASMCSGFSTGGYKSTDGLKPGGLFVLKENIARSVFYTHSNTLNSSYLGFVLDKEDKSVTRSDAYFKQLFKKCGLHIYKMKDQRGLPDELFAVKMYALTTELPKRVNMSKSKRQVNRPAIIK
ncbi:hypothetical protein RD792_003815 [Penstemon davidsonii]|uniref:Alpha N-terminal protein methyltransferase 1 n=1 Tax=Penstemon davidsonii TaxID=160366 RepID=A0ABR0DFQ3_9LAMI|nr:hypothetical protein RD792_003815 [Penstemon davidsonii]